MIDDPEDGEWPLKALFWEYGAKRGIHAACSKDGIVWNRLGLVLPGWGDRFNAASCKIDGRYMLLGRRPAHADTQELGGIPRNRVVSYAESEDLLHWSTPELVLSPDCDDPPYMQFYSATLFPYAGRLPY